MTSQQVQTFVTEALDQYVYESPTGPMIGTPWTPAKAYQYRDRLRAVLVKPVLKRVILRDTADQVQSTSPATAEVWVVAKFNDYWLFFDPNANEFGLALKSKYADEYSTIGVRGDLVGVYCSA